MWPPKLRRWLRSATMVALVVFVAAELALRVLGYGYPPQGVLPPPTPEDRRGFYTAGYAYTRYHPQLLWDLDPAALREVAGGGYCGPPLPSQRDTRERLLIVLRDSAGCGLRRSEDWPVQLQTLLDRNAIDGRRHRVVDAGVWGYSSFQGLRRFEQLVELRPDLVFFGFGTTDAGHVRLSDADYAARLRRREWLARSRVATALAQSLGLLDNAADGAAPIGPRVPREDYREALRRFVRSARHERITPVLLVGASPPEEGRDADRAAAYAAVVRQVAAEEDAWLLNAEAALAPKGDDLPGDVEDSFGLAVRFLDQLKAMGFVETNRRLDSEVEPGLLEDFRPELLDGFWQRETWSGNETGRWTGEAASVRLERRDDEGGLELDARFLHPSDRTRLGIEVNGVAVGRLEGPNGAVRRTLDIRGVPGRFVTVRLLAASPFVPGGGDTRTLGVFLRHLALVASPYGPEVYPADAADDARELGGGWWQREEWPDGRRGRWMKSTARLYLGRYEAENRLLLELEGSHPDGYATVRVDINGRFVTILRVENAPATYSIDLDAVRGKELEVRLTVERPFVPREVYPGSGDDRRLGVFVLSARLRGDFDP